MTPVATKVKCPNCGKAVKSVKMHEKYCIALHPELAPPPPEDIPQDAAEPVRDPQDVVADNKEARIAKILYNDIVKPLCEEHVIEMGAWEEIDQSDYFKIASRILSAVKGV